MLIVTVSAFLLSITILYVTRRYLAGNRLCSGDTFFHLLISKSIKKNHWRYPSILQNVTFDEDEKKYSYLAYPPLLHYLTALFPTKTFAKVSRSLNLVVLSLVSTIAATLVYTLTSDIAFALLTTVLILFNMSVFELEVTFTPRPLGLLFYSLIFTLTVFFPQGWVSFAALITVTAMLLLTHKFALQVLLFVLVPYAVLFNQLFSIIGMALGFLVAILISRGSYVKVLREHLSWLIFYSKHPNNEPYIYKFRRIITRNFWSLPLILLSIGTFIGVFKGGFNTLMAKTLFWAFVPIIVAFIVTFPKLSFLGEDYRYIEYTLVPAMVATASFWLTSKALVLVFLPVYLLVYVVVLSKYKRHLYNTRELIDANDIQAYQDLTKLKFENVLVFPPTRTLEVNFFTDLQVIHPVRSTVKTNEEHLTRIFNTYRISHVLSFRDIDPYGRFESLSKMMNMKKLLSLGSFDLFQLNIEKKEPSPSNH